MAQLDDNQQRIESAEIYRRFMINESIPIEVRLRLSGVLTGIEQAMFEAMKAAEAGETKPERKIKHQINPMPDFITIGKNIYAEQVNQAIESHANSPWPIIAGYYDE